MAHLVGSGQSSSQQRRPVWIHAIKDGLVSEESLPHSCDIMKGVECEIERPFYQERKNDANWYRGDIFANNDPTSSYKQLFCGLQCKKVQVGSVEDSFGVIGKAAEQDIESDIDISNIRQRDHQRSPSLEIGLEFRED